MNWFRVPTHIIHMEPAEAAAWLWLLGMWHAGHTPRHNEIRRHLGWGAGRVQAFIPKVGKWAVEAGASMPPEIAEQFRSSSGAVAEQQRSSSGAGETRKEADKADTPEQQRSNTGAVAEQERSDSRARNSSGRKEREEKKEREGEGAPQPEASRVPQTSQDTTQPVIAAPGPSPAPEKASTIIHGTQATVVIPEAPVVESPLVEMLSRSGLSHGQVSVVARKLMEAGIQSPTDEAALVYDEFSLGNLVGNQHKGKVIPAFRRAGWLPPKERRQTIPALPPGLKVIDEKGNPIGVTQPTTKAERKAVETDDWFAALRNSVQKEEEVTLGK